MGSLLSEDLMFIQATHAPQLGRDAHFRQLRQCSALLWSALGDYVRKHPLEAYLGGANSVLQKRSGHPSLRLHLSAICFELGKRDVSINEKEFTLIDLCIPEIFNISTYEANTALDSKGREAEATTANNVVRSHLWYSLAQHVIATSAFLDDAGKAFFLSAYRQATDDVYAGQFIDSNVLTFDNARNMTKSDYMTIYLKRCRLIGASTLKVCAASCLLGNAQCSAFPLLERLLGRFGIAGQVLNDLSDFIPRSTHFKSRDNCADLRNGRLTLPYYLLAENGVDLDGLRRDAVSGKLDLNTLRGQFLEADLRRQTMKLIAEITHQEFSEIFAKLENLYPLDQLSPLASIIPFLTESRILKALDQ